MKKILNISLAIATLAMVSCSNDKGEGVAETPVDNKITFTAVSAASNDGVVDETTTANIEDFGIFVEPESGNYNYTYSNIEVTNIDGVWSSSRILFWYDLDEQTTFAAYSPYNSDLGISLISDFEAAMSSIYANGFIKADQSNEEDYKASDLLYATGSFKPNDGAVAVSSGKITYDGSFVKTQFKHMCALVVFEIKLTQEYMNIDTENYPIATLIEELSSSRSTESFVTISELDANNCRTITIKTIIEPRELVEDTSLSLNVYTDDGEVSIWSSTTLPDTFEAGNIYTLSNLTLGDDIITSLGDDISVSEWIDANEEDITTDFTLD